MFSIRGPNAMHVDASSRGATFNLVAACRLPRAQEGMPPAKKAKKAKKGGENDTNAPIATAAAADIMWQPDDTQSAQDAAYLLAALNDASDGSSHTTQALKRHLYKMVLDKYRKSRRQSRQPHTVTPLGRLASPRSGLAIPKAEIVEREHPQTECCRWRDLKGTFTRMVLYRPQRVSESAPKHTTRCPGPSTHIGIAQRRLVRRRRAAASSFDGPGDVKYDACERDMWWSLERCQCNRRGV